MDLNYSYFYVINPSLQLPLLPEYKIYLENTRGALVGRSGAVSTHGDTDPVSCPDKVRRVVLGCAAPLDNSGRIQAALFQNMFANTV